MGVDVTVMMVVMVSGEPDAAHEAQHVQRLPHQRRHAGRRAAGAGRQPAGGAITYKYTL